MANEWTPKMEAQYQATIDGADPSLTDRCVTAIYDAVEAACGRRHSAYDFPMRFIVAATIAEVQKNG